MPRGAKIGNRGNKTCHPRKWTSTKFVSGKFPPHLMPLLYRLAQAADRDPRLIEKLTELLDQESSADRAI